MWTKPELVRAEWIGLLRIWANNRAGLAAAVAAVSLASTSASGTSQSAPGMFILSSLSNMNLGFFASTSVESRLTV
jgi:hypothetical protein